MVLRLVYWGGDEWKANDVERASFIKPSIWFVGDFRGRQFMTPKQSAWNFTFPSTELMSGAESGLVSIRLLSQLET